VASSRPLLFYASWKLVRRKISKTAILDMGGDCTALTLYYRGGMSVACRLAVGQSGQERH